MTTCAAPRDLTIRRWIGRAVAGLAVSLMALVIGANGSDASRGAGGRPPAQLIERAGCDRAVRESGSAKPTDVRGDSRPVVSIIVPATALIRLDHAGHVLAVATNTGCAPRPGDDHFYLRFDGTVEQTSITRLAHRRWIGDFTTSGVFVSQRR